MNVSSADLSLSFGAYIKPTSDPDLYDSGSIRLLLEFADSMTDGTGADQIDFVYADSGSLIGDADADYDLYGSLSDVFGATINAARIKGIFFKNTSSTAAVINVGGGTDGAGTAAFDSWITSTAADGSEAVIVRAGGGFMLYAPDATAYVVTNTSADTLSLLETASLAATYELYLIGATS